MPMTLIDTHCHLDFYKNLEQIINNAKKNKVGVFIAPAIDIQSAQKLLDISKHYPNIKVALGIHPTNNTTQNSWQEYPYNQVKTINKLLSNHQDIVAIGECGLDFKYAKTKQEKKVQIQLFKQHIKWAINYNLPLIIHNRKAGLELIQLIKQYSKYGKLSGVFHCFANSKKLAKQIMQDLPKFYFGIGGLLTLDTGLQTIVKDIIPINKIILETDSPYLTPKPIRLTKAWPNEPANIFYIAEKLANIKNISLKLVKKTTTQNTKYLFKF